MRFVAACEGANKLMAKIRPGRNGAFRQVHKPRTNVRLKHEREVVCQYPLVAPPGSLHSNRVDAEKFRGVRPAVVLLWYVGLEVLRAGPLDAPQLTGERRATCRVRQVAWFAGRARVDSVPSPPVRLPPSFSAGLDPFSSIFLPPLLRDPGVVP